MFQQKRIALALIAAFATAGCSTTVSRTDVLERVDQLTKEINSVKGTEAQRRATDEQLFVRVHAPYLSGRTVPQSKDARLPAVFSRSSGFVRAPSQEGFTIPQVADLITKNYGIRVRIRPDVFLPASSLVPGGGQDAGRRSSAGGAAGAAVGPNGMSAGGPGGAVFNPGGPVPIGSMGVGATAAGYESRIDFDFNGMLSEYLDRISSKLGINYEWNEADRELVLYRLVRKTFVLNTAPASVEVTSSVTKGTSSNGGGGGGGGGGASTGGTGGSSSSMATMGNAEAKYTLSSDAWTSTVAVLNKMRTPAGQVEANPATRTITMIDTRDVVSDAERYIGQQNEIMGRQAVLQVRLIRVSVSKLNQLGADVNLILQKLTSAGTPDWRLTTTGAGTPGPVVTSGLAYTVLDGRASGSTLIVDALREIGDVSDEFTQDVPVKNNRSVPISDFASFGYLERTTPATGGLGGTSLPGLVPGTVTSGTAIVLTPSITSGDSLSLLVSMDRSADPVFDTIATGSGETFQQIQIPRQRGLKIDTEVEMKNNQTLVLLGQVKDGHSNTLRNGITSIGNAAQSQREIQLLLVTPRIVSGA